MKLVLTTALILGASLHGRASAQAGDPLLKDPEKKTERFDPAKVTYLTAWPKPQSKDQLVTDIERMVKATIPEMAEGGKQGVLAEGTAAVPFVLERYGKEKDEDVLQRLKTVLIEISKPEQTRLLAQDFDHRDVRHRTFALWRCAAFPDPSIKALSEAAWAKVQKQGEKADADERYAAALCATSSGSMQAFEVLFEYAQKGWAKRGVELRVALDAVRGAEASKVLLGKLGGDRKARIAALKMLAGCGDKSVVGTLKPLLEDPDNEVRVVTINALRGIVDGDGPLEQLSSFEAIEMAKKWKSRI
jgi:HEAT repeat protein